MDIFIRYTVELAIVIPDALFAFLSVRKYLRWRPWVTFLLSGILLPALVAAAAWVSTERLLPVIPVLCVEGAFLFLLFSLCVKLSLNKKIFFFLNAIMFGAFCLLYSILIMAPYEEGSNLWESTRLLPLNFGLVAVALSSVIRLAFLKTLLVELPSLIDEDYFERVWNYLSIIPLGILLLIVWMVPIRPSVLLVGRVRPIALFMLALVPLTALLIYHLLWLVVMNTARNVRLQEENTVLQIEGKRYEALRRYMEETRALRHDFHNHLLVINDFAKKGQTEEILKYLSPLTETVESYEGYSGNRAVDAVAAHYAALARAQQTKVDWKIQIPDKLPIRESDYCAVLGNLLENALRAVSGLSDAKRHVTVISSMLSDEMLGLAIDNPFEGELAFGKNGLPRSEREGHGIGLMSVLNTVHRHAGSMNIKTEDGIFSVEILLCAAAPREEKNEEELLPSRDKENSLL